MTYGALQLLDGFLGLLKLTESITSPLGLGVTLWIWLNTTLPYDTALTLWLMALVPLMALRPMDGNE
jgi:hypothetical protein